MEALFHSHVAGPQAVEEGDKLFNALCTTWEISIQVLKCFTNINELKLNPLLLSVVKQVLNTKTGLMRLRKLCLA